MLAAALGAVALVAGRGQTDPPGGRPAAAAGLRVVALGSAQDGGLPQIGCECPRCAAARRNPALGRHVASLAIQVPVTGQVLLVDATPDLPAQVERIHLFRPHPEGGIDRRPVDGVLLTHAHIGHYLGLAWFGFEALNTDAIPVWASPRMAAFLRGSGPWSELVRRRNIDLRICEPDRRLQLADGVAVTPIAVPHRDELSDTLGFVVHGGTKNLLYVPDTDSWRAWPRPLPEILARYKVDVAVVDGTFYSAAELPDRDPKTIPHPPMTDTMDLLAPLVASGGLRVYFTHLNHTNPALDPASPARRAIEARGFRVLADGEAFVL
jgi:pyrroloquinoline quinone biosynthesis protein B